MWNNINKKSIWVFWFWSICSFWFVATHILASKTKAFNNVFLQISVFIALYMEVSNVISAFISHSSEVTRRQRWFYRFSGQLSWRLNFFSATYCCKCSVAPLTLPPLQGLLSGMICSGTVTCTQLYGHTFSGITWHQRQMPVPAAAGILSDSEKHEFRQLFWLFPGVRSQQCTHFW